MEGVQDPVLDSLKIFLKQLRSAPCTVEDFVLPLQVAGPAGPMSMSSERRVSRLECAPLITNVVCQLLLALLLGVWFLSLRSQCCSCDILTFLELGLCHPYVTKHTVGVGFAYLRISLYNICVYLDNTALPAIAT